MSTTEINQTNASPANLDDPEAEADIHFEPVVQLKEVEQEKPEEEIQYETRAVCMRYDAENKEWKERGRGAIKIVKHPKTKHTRVYLVRDQVLKLACNHFCLPTIVMKDIPNNDKCLMYAVGQDFAQETPCQMLFTFRFNSAEICKEFKEAFKKAQDEMQEALKKD